MVESGKMINIDTDFDSAVKQACKIYFEGGIFIYPTDTVYGFGANPFNEESVNRIDEIKERLSGKWYILLIDDIDNLLKYVELKSEKNMDFLISIWPNPVSVILNLNSKTKNILKRDTVAFRIPNNRFCQKLLSEIKMPLISTSVNKINKPPMTEPSLIKDTFASEVDAVFYTDKKSYYNASTIIDLCDSELKIVREGKIKFEELLAKYEA
ncbi:MAG: L-threonylcarbamoyladenylate synthase [Ignavibacteriaceae bacterium]|nr:L-threonylcarbamoyladenylate synthase [Ignavibacteriaceae bacterium]